MTISKEERAELRRVVTSHPYIRLFAWVRGVDGEDDAIICDEGGTQICDDMGELHVDLTIAAVNALPKTLDALDAADERIAGLEKECQRLDGTVTRLVMRNDKAADENKALKARIAELEAADQWRPIEEVPYDVELLLTDGANVISGNKYRGWWNFAKGADFAPTHFRVLPALPEGGV